MIAEMIIDTLIVTGFLTDQCVDHTLRDAADRGFYPVCISDGCATHTEERHKNALRAFAGHRLFPFAAPTGGMILIAAWLALTAAALAALMRN